ncbi:MAG: hypothetical protein K8S56_08355, partial [Candidatus Cloacimonetes bacterium]|nr:hypothetical protein [Candidatus Cloacimonadota bacterium]
MKRVILLLMLFSMAMLFAGVIQHSAEITSLNSRLNDSREDANLVMMNPGEPMMPFESYRFVLPFGEKITHIEVIYNGRQQLSGRHDIPQAHQPTPTSSGQANKSARSAAIYQNDAPYPTQNYDLVNVGRLAGVDIATLNIFPYRYKPLSGELYWYDSVEIEITTTPDETIGAEQSAMISHHETYQSRISALTVNPELTRNYPQTSTPTPSRYLADPTDPHTFLIITSQEHFDVLNDYADWKTQQGISSVVYTTEDIYAQGYAGDQPAQIRSFILEALMYWASSATPLEYCLLAGDDEIIPIRYAWAYVNELGSIPCDMYYGCLDGNWNANGDNIYGGLSDNVDYYAEVHMGRFTCDTTEEFENIINKIKCYVEYPTATNDKITLVGEQLDDEPTYGAMYKDEIGNNPQMIPTWLQVTRFYERDETFSETALINQINDNQAGIMNHMGHCDYSYVMHLSNGQVQSLSNTEYPFLYSQGCYAIAFDEASSGGAEATGEVMINSKHGWMGFVGNTRYGWYAHGSTNGASQQFDKQFFLAVFLQNYKELGFALTFSKEANIPLFNAQNGTYRWTFFELIVNGDPSLALQSGNGTMPDISVFNYTITEHNGDGDGIINPGEEVAIELTLINNPGFGAAVDITLFLDAEDEYASASGDPIELGSLGQGDMVDNNGLPYIIQLNDDCPMGNIKIGIVVKANVGFNNYFAKRTMLDINCNLYHAGFPLETNTSFKSSPLFIDLDGDGKHEVVNADAGGTIHAVNYLGQDIAGFPVTVAGDVRSSIAMGNMDNDDTYEIALATFDGNLIGIDHDGSELFTVSQAGSFVSTPSLADLNGDGRKELIAVNMLGHVHVVDGDGSYLPGFPLVIGITNTAGVGVGDIDADDSEEIIYAGWDGKLYIINADATFTTIDASGVLGTAPLIFENNTKIAVGTTTGELHILSNLRDLTTIQLDSAITKSVMAADFSGDHSYELGFATVGGYLYLMEDDGTPLSGWPIDIGEGISGCPVAGDLNNDGSPDLIIVDNIGSVHAFSVDGTYLPDFPITNGIPTETSPAIGDFDRNGMADIAIGTTVGISVWGLKYAQGDLKYWSVFRGCAERVGNTQFIVGVDDDETAPLYSTG